MVNFDYDCSGWATKANTKCYDGLTIAEDAFKGCSGQTVPMVYNHDHSSLDNVIGHALLENRKGGAVSMFDDFDIDYNAMKYLIETRCSGALTTPYSAMAIEWAA